MDKHGTNTRQSGNEHYGAINMGSRTGKNIRSTKKMESENGITDIIQLGPEQKQWQEKGLEWLRYDYSLKPTDIVFDIGSYRGEFANEIKKRYGCKVECFEALDNRAAWIEDGEIEMGGEYLYTSLFNNVNRKKYKCVDIARFVTKEIALMKINVEGGEYSLIQYLINKGRSPS